MNRLYIASASKGSKEFIRDVASLAACYSFVFVPVLGYQGVEDLENRGKVMEACLWMIEHWAEALLIVYEGVSTTGVWAEADRAIELGIPVCIYSPFADVKYKSRVLRVREFYQVRRWILGLQKVTRNT